MPVANSAILITVYATSNEQESTTRNTLALPRTSVTGPQKDVPVAISAMLLQRAIEYHEKDVSIAKDVGDRAGEGRAYGNLGNAYNNLTDYQRVIEYHEKDLKIAKHVGNRAGEGGAYCNLGYAYLAIGDFQRAIENHEKHLSIAKDVSDRAGEHVPLKSRQCL